MGFSDLWEFWRKTCLFMTLSIMDNTAVVKYSGKEYTPQSKQSTFSTSTAVLRPTVNTQGTDQLSKLSLLFTAPQPTLKKTNSAEKKSVKIVSKY